MEILCLEESMSDEVDREESEGKVTREREREREREIKSMEREKKI